MILPNLPTITRLKKAMAFVVALSFLFSNVVFADTPKETTLDTKKDAGAISDPDKIIIPRDYGLIKSRYSAKDSKKLIIHIQDAHCNYEAQSNIIKILECLIKNDGLRLVSVEGADGFIDTSWFKAFPDAEIRKEVADYFMKKGEITGPEFLSITSDYPIKLFGAETRSYYIDNLNAFTSSYPLKEDTERYFNQIKTIINKLKDYIYSEELRELDAKDTDYEAKKLPFADYVRYLEGLGEKYKVNLRQYENLFKLISVLIFEKKIDFNVVDKERASLIDAVTKKLDKEKLTELVNKSLEFKSGKISSAEYYSYLKALSIKYGISLSEEYPNLFNYIIYNGVYSRIENEQLFEDIKKFEQAIKEKLFANDDQRTLEKLSRHINILIGLVNIRLLNGDFEYYKSRKEEFTHEAFADFIGKMTTRYGFAYEVDAPSQAVQESMPRLEDFYAIAIKRDEALVDNTIQAMRKEDVPVSVLVTGGFHSEGIMKLLEKQNISYVVVCPNITKDVETPYIKILTNQRTPLEDILSDTAGTTADAKNVKSGMLAPYLITAARINNIEELGIRNRTDDDLKLWAEMSIRPWLPQAIADLAKMNITPTAAVIAVRFNADVDEAVNTYIETTQLKSAEAKAAGENAKKVKELSAAVIGELLAGESPVREHRPIGQISVTDAYSAADLFDAYILQQMAGELIKKIPQLPRLMKEYNEWRNANVGPLEKELAVMEQDYEKLMSDKKLNEADKLMEGVKVLKKNIEDMIKKRVTPIDDLISELYNQPIVESYVGSLAGISHNDFVRDIATLEQFMKNDDYEVWLGKARALMLSARVGGLDIYAGAASRLFGEGQKVDATKSYAAHDVYEIYQSMGNKIPEDAIKGLSVMTRIAVQKWIEIETELKEKYTSLGISKEDKDIVAERNDIVHKKPWIIMINDESGVPLLQEIVKNNHYGYNPELVVFVVQPTFKGHGFDENGKPVRLENTRPAPAGHGSATMQAVTRGRAFRVDATGHIYGIKESAQTYLRQKTGVQYWIQGRVNDMIKLGYSQSPHPGGLSEHAIDMGIMALALKKMGNPDTLNEGNNAIFEQVGPDPRIKGGTPLQLGKKKFMIEQIAMSPETRKVILGPNPQSRFYTFYKWVALEAMKKEDLPVYLRFRDGAIYPETITGDLTMLDSTNSDFVMETTRRLTDYKDQNTAHFGFEAAYKQDKNSTFRNRIEELSGSQKTTAVISGFEEAPGLAKKGSAIGAKEQGAVTMSGAALTEKEHGARASIAREKARAEISPLKVAQVEPAQVESQTPYEETYLRAMETHHAGRAARELAIKKAGEKTSVTKPMHLIFVQSAIPDIQLQTTLALNITNLCKKYYDDLNGYTADVVPTYKEAIALLSEHSDDWNKTNTIVGLIDEKSLDETTKALQAAGLEDHTKILAMQKFDKNQYVPIMGFFDLMATLVQINKELDEETDKELLDAIQNLLDKIGAKETAKLRAALTTAAYFENPLRFAYNFIVRLLPPLRKQDPKDLPGRYKAAHQVAKSM